MRRPRLGGYSRTMSPTEKSPEPTGYGSNQPQLPASHDETSTVDIESSLAAWICVLGSFLFLMPTFGISLHHTYTQSH